MNTLLLEPPDLHAGRAEDRARAARSPRRQCTLDDLIAGTWEGLLAGQPVACPVCAEPMKALTQRAQAAARAACPGCASQLR